MAALVELLAGPVLESELSLDIDDLLVAVEVLALKCASLVGWLVFLEAEVKAEVTLACLTRVVAIPGHSVKAEGQAPVLACNGGLNVGEVVRTGPEEVQVGRARLQMQLLAPVEYLEPGLLSALALQVHELGMGDLHDV